MNENYAQPDLPAGVEVDVVQRRYQYASYQASIGEGQAPNGTQFISLMGSGAILTEVIQAAGQLAAQGMGVTVYSVTSWSELVREGRACEQRRLAGLLRGGFADHPQGCDAGTGRVSKGPGAAR